MKTAVLVANAGFTIINFRKEVIESLKAKGYRVILCCPKDKDLDELFAAQVNELGVEHIEVNVARKGLNPLEDLKLLIHLIQIFKELRPSFVFNYTIKPVIYSSLAAWYSKVPSINSFITGLGYTFINKSFKGHLIQFVVKSLYRVSLSRCHHVFFQNKDDEGLFIDMKLVSKNKTTIINGSGVNLKRFYPRDTEKIKNSFIFVGRLLKDKGIYELIDAMKLVKKENSEVRFFVCGALDRSNPASLSSEELDQLIASKLFHYLGTSHDVASDLADKEVMVLPSYREGTPRSVLEAMAMGMPIITTDAPGCRETVVDGKNGFLVPVGSVKELAVKILTMIDNPELLESFGKASLEIAQTKYDVQAVNQRIFETVGISD